MATSKSAGATKSIRDSESKRLGVKRFDGQFVREGEIIVRQRGSKFLAGKNTRYGKDYTIFAVKSGYVKFRTLRKKKFDGSYRYAKRVDVIEAPHSH